MSDRPFIEGVLAEHAKPATHLKPGDVITVTDPPSNALWIVKRVRGDIVEAEADPVRKRHASRYQRLHTTTATCSLIARPGDRAKAEILDAFVDRIRSLEASGAYGISRPIADIATDAYNAALDLQEVEGTPSASHQIGAQ